VISRIRVECGDERVKSHLQAPASSRATYGVMVVIGRIRVKCGDGRVKSRDGIEYQFHYSSTRTFFRSSTRVLDYSEKLKFIVDLGPQKNYCKTV